MSLGRVADFPGGMPSYYRQYLEWVRHAGPAATVAAFDVDWEPIGPKLRRTLCPDYIEVSAEGLLTLTGLGMAELTINWADKAPPAPVL